MSVSWQFPGAPAGVLAHDSARVFETAVVGTWVGSEPRGPVQGVHAG
jgi:hypothetical protein